MARFSVELHWTAEVYEDHGTRSCPRDNDEGSTHYFVSLEGQIAYAFDDGHIPGHQSLRVRAATAEFILRGDACYLRHALDNDHLPGIPHDREAALRTYALFGKFEAADARIRFGHDPELWKTVPQAPMGLA